jgi:23S rRNA (cytosine1962-C5)-methyltransferase
MSAGEPEPYALLDSGDGRKLEQAGPFLLDRQAAAAVWKPNLAAAKWKQADAFHHRSESGGGHWDARSTLPESWRVTHGDLVFEVKPTPFGHLGLFAEQEPQWSWLEEFVSAQERDPAPQILNLFAYTGGTTLALARAGARVCHVDAARGVVDWARRNAELNGLSDKPIRWIVDDCLTFLRREQRRGRRYDGIILDPPSFGRGRNQEVFKIDRDVRPLLEACGRVLTESPLLFLLSCHTPGYTAGVLENLVQAVLPDGHLASAGGEMHVTERDSGRRLPAGSFYRVSRA